MEDVSGSSGSLQSFLESVVRSKPKITAYIFTHRQADPDALCSAYGIAEVLRKLSNIHSAIADCTILAPEGGSTLANNVAAKLQIKFEEEIDLVNVQSADFIAVVDSGERRLLGNYQEAIRKNFATKCVIDHHRHETEQEALAQWAGFDLVIVRADATSTSEIIANELREELLDEHLATVLMTGILFDSQHLGIANKSTLEAALKLLRAGATIESTKAILKGQAERSEILARLKSAQRLVYKEVGPYVFAQASVSSFHAAVARMLIEIGADVAVAHGESNGEGRASIRSSQRFFRETGIDLGIVLKEIAARNSGIVGGGHPTAASISGKQDPKIIVRDILEVVETLLPKKL